MDRHSFDTIIIGGGAGGLCAAIALKQAVPAERVAILERNDRIGKKLLATGNGRCNLGNVHASPRAYHSVAGDAAAFCAPALAAFPAAANAEFFEGLGLLLRTDAAGRQYPWSNQAAGVLDLFRLLLARHRVAIFTDCAAQKISRTELGYQIKAGDGAFSCRRLIIACGGLASPQISSAQGFAAVAAGLGLSTTECHPALTQIKTAGSLPKAMKGLRLSCELELITAERRSCTEGELLFTDYGVSGIPAFELSREVSLNFARKQPVPQELRIDALPQLTAAELRALLARRQADFSGGSLTLENFLVGLINKKLGQQVLKAIGLAPLSRSADELTADELSAIAAALKAITLTVTGTTGWRNAQVTAGGLALDEFDPTTLECLQHADLYAIGEALDLDGDCGGYNLTWAWSSARLAARAICAKQENNE